MHGVVKSLTAHRPEGPHMPVAEQKAVLEEALAAAQANDYEIELGVWAWDRALRALAPHLPATEDILAIVFLAVADPGGEREFGFLTLAVSAYPS